MKSRTRKQAAHARGVHKRAADRSQKRKQQASKRQPTPRNQRTKGHAPPVTFAAKLGVVNRVRLANLDKRLNDIWAEIERKVGEIEPLEKAA